MPKRIQRSRKKGSKLPPDAVCVTRGTRWGNPHRLLGNAKGHFRVALRLTGLYHETAELAVEAFRVYAIERMRNEPTWLDHLRGKDLACWCPLDSSCHANVLIELANYREDGFKVPITNRECDYCGRLEGSTKDRSGYEDGVPLGELEKCGACGSMVCPECIDEADCCFSNEAFENGEIDAPPGWEISEPSQGLPHGAVSYRRKAVAS